MPFQQACLLTRGVYQRPVDQMDLLQLMLSHNLPSATSRTVLNAPMQVQSASNTSFSNLENSFLHQKTMNGHFDPYSKSSEALFPALINPHHIEHFYFFQKTVDFRASCFCHRRPVEFAFMCSVCLALTCELPESSCATCGTPRRSDGSKQL